MLRLFQHYSLMKDQLSWASVLTCLYSFYLSGAHSLIKAASGQWMNRLSRSAKTDALPGPLKDPASQRPSNVAAPQRRTPLLHVQKTKKRAAGNKLVCFRLVVCARALRYLLTRRASEWVMKDGCICAASRIPSVSSWMKLLQLLLPLHTLFFLLTQQTIKAL